MEENTNMNTTTTRDAGVKAAKLALYEGESELGVLEKIAADLRAARAELRGEVARGFDEGPVTQPTYAVERKIAPAPAERTSARASCRAALHRDSDQVGRLERGKA